MTIGRALARRSQASPTASRRPALPPRAPMRCSFLSAVELQAMGHTHARGLRRTYGLGRARVSANPSRGLRSFGHGDVPSGRSRCLFGSAFLRGASNASCGRCAVRKVLEAHSERGSRARPRGSRPGMPGRPRAAAAPVAAGAPRLCRRRRGGGCRSRALRTRYCSRSDVSQEPTRRPRNALRPPISGRP